MENKLTKKYGLFTAICMVVGIVIGSGVFFKAQVIMERTGGNTLLGIVAWLIGGAIMLSCLLAFAFLGQKYERVNGIVDYAEATVGPKYGYLMGWFTTTIYFPGMTSALAWLSARYTLVFITSVNPDFPLIPISETLCEKMGMTSVEVSCLMGPECITLALFFMVGSYVLNSLSPKLAGKFQTTTTVIKLIPLILMGIIGVIYGLSNGMLQNNLTSVVTPAAQLTSNPLFAAVCATAFAYEGWIIATSINSEIKDAKKNLPKALVLGGLIIVAVYILYFVGLAGGASASELTSNGATVAFNHVFGPLLGNVLNLFVAISCMGTLNGLMLACSRCMYSLGARGEGPHPKMFVQVDKVTNMPNNSAVIALLVTAVWFVYFYLSNLAGTWSGPFVFDSTELPIITIYLMYLPIFFQWMRKEKEQNVLRRFVMPILASIGSIFMVVACVVSHKWACVWYLIVFAVIMAFGALFAKKKEI